VYRPRTHRRRRKKAYGRLLRSEVRELEQLREETTKRKRLVVDLSLCEVIPQDTVQRRL
jgi:hypothetical protein